MRQQGGKTAGKIQVQDKPLCERGEAEPLRLGVTGWEVQKTKVIEASTQQRKIVRATSGGKRRLYRFFNSHVSSANGTNHM